MSDFDVQDYDTGETITVSMKKRPLGPSIYYHTEEGMRRVENENRTAIIITTEKLTVLKDTLNLSLSALFSKSSTPQEYLEALFDLRNALDRA